MPIKLNIGTRTKNKGWKNFDIDPGPDVDYVGDCMDLSQLADNSVETIYASHVLEHVSYQKDLQATLKEWFRVLVSGGEVMISVPDLETLCRLFLAPTLTGKQRFQVMQVMFGGQMDEFDFHSVGLSSEWLGGYLQGAGFAQIRRVEKFNLFQDCSIAAIAGVPISLNMTAQKP
jgi:predicted SAM-dependent methyltransferase